jgi:2-succinyl-6-hydroxy-2,4-cyclohexadiene-1-carboxylate synthase
MTPERSNDLHVELDGDGPPLLLLHGFTGGARTMWPLGRRLADVRHVAAVDLPGHGRTGVPANPHLFGFEHTVDALARLLEQRNHMPADVVGYSMGGRIALGLAVRHPEHVASLSLIGASAGISDAVERSARRRSDDDLAEDLEDHGLEMFVERWMASPIFDSQVRLGPDALADARAQRMDNDPEGLAGSLRGAGSGSQPSYWHDLAGVEVPTLLVVGDEDPRFRAIAMRLAAGLSGSTISVVPEAGHAAHLENLERTSAVILGFLADLDEDRQAAGGRGWSR